MPDGLLLGLRITTHRADNGEQEDLLAQHLPLQCFGCGAGIGNHEGKRTMNRLRCPRLRLSRLMEAIAALAVLLVFWIWRNYYRHTTIFEILTVLVTGISVFVIATVLSGATEGQ